MKDLSKYSSNQLREALEKAINREQDALEKESRSEVDKEVQRLQGAKYLLVTRHKSQENARNFSKNLIKVSHIEIRKTTYHKVKWLIDIFSDESLSVYCDSESGLKQYFHKDGSETLNGDEEVIEVSEEYYLNVMNAYQNTWKNYFNDFKI